MTQARLRFVLLDKTLSNLTASASIDSNFAVTGINYAQPSDFANVRVVCDD